MESLMSDLVPSLCLPCLSLAPSKLPHSIGWTESWADLTFQFMTGSPWLFLNYACNCIFYSLLNLSRALGSRIMQGRQSQQNTRTWPGRQRGLKIKGCDVCIINLFLKYIKRSRYSTPQLHTGQRIAFHFYIFVTAWWYCIMSSSHFIAVTSPVLGCITCRLEL